MAHGVALPVGMSVTGRLDQTCARILTWNANKRRGIKEPDSITVALRKQGYVAAFPALALGGDVPVSTWNKALACEPSPLRSVGSADQAEAACNGNALSSWSPRLLTDWDRFDAMNSTVGARLSHGKSGVHGMGVFARLPIKAGDWVLEYQGEIIRVLYALSENTQVFVCIPT